MDVEKVIAVAGLLVELGGVGIIWHFGWPQPELEEGVSIGLEASTPYGAAGQTVADHNRDIVARRARYKRYSLTGLLVLCLGFELQILGNLI